MNRVIKFRAWDKANKRFAEDYLVGNILYELHRNKNTDVLNHFDLSQFTGLLDKNGKEIYEGDIVHVIHGDDREMMGVDGDYIDEVYFDEQCAGFMISRPIGADSLEFDLGKSIEIIGDIYNNPDLFK